MLFLYKYLKWEVYLYEFIYGQFHPFYNEINFKNKSNEIFGRILFTRSQSIFKGKMIYVLQFWLEVELIDKSWKTCEIERMVWVKVFFARFSLFGLGVFLSFFSHESISSTLSLSLSLGPSTEVIPFEDRPPLRFLFYFIFTFAISILYFFPSTLNNVWNDSKHWCPITSTFGTINFFLLRM